MERHLRLTPVAVLVLALLREGDMHPYEMMRLFRQRREDRLVAITNGTLYHTVGRLERAGLLAEVGIEEAGVAPQHAANAFEVLPPALARQSELGMKWQPDARTAKFASRSTMSGSSDTS
jgi:hypothetical protein